MRLEDLEKNPEKTFEYIKQRLARMGRFPNMKLVHRYFEVKDSGDHRYFGHTYIQIGKNIYLRWIVGRIEHPIFYQMGPRYCDFRSLKFIIGDLAYPDRDWQAYAYADRYEKHYIKAGLHPNPEKLRFEMEKQLANDLANASKGAEKRRNRFNKVFGLPKQSTQELTQTKSVSDFVVSSTFVFENTQQIVKSLADRLNALAPVVTIEDQTWSHVFCPEVSLYETIESNTYKCFAVSYNGSHVLFVLYVDSQYKRLFIIPAGIEDGNIERDGNKPHPRYQIKSAVFKDER